MFSSAQCLRQGVWLLAAAIIASPQTRARATPPQINVAEQYLLHSVNEARAANGLSSLRFSPQMQNAARAHAVAMVRARSLQHQLPGEDALLQRGLSTGARFHHITENIGTWPSIPDMHTALMQSRHHRENILDPDATAVGIAVIQWQGQFWAVEDFCDCLA